MVRCVDCKVCHTVLRGHMADSVLWCPAVSQYRCPSIFRDCNEYVAMSPSDYLERVEKSRVRRDVLVSAARVVHVARWLAADYRAME